MRVGLAFDRFFLRHDTGPTHAERPERLEAIVDALADAGLARRLAAVRIEPASIETLALIHEPAYVDLVRMACEQGMTFLGDGETTISAESYEAARLAAGAAVAACDAVISGELDRAFCAVRPPGHHAERDLAMGFCLFNNVAIAAEHAIRRRGVRRVAIVDFDAHHGNGTQHAFEDRSDVLFISLHEGPETQYPHTGYETERGRGDGEGFTLNVPMRAGTGDRVCRRAFEDRVLPSLRAFAPELLLISAGFDAMQEDHIANLNLDASTYGWMTRELATVSTEHCGGRIVSVLEGGYDLPSLGRGIIVHLRSLLDD